MKPIEYNEFLNINNLTVQYFHNKKFLREDNQVENPNNQDQLKDLGKYKFQQQEKSNISNPEDVDGYYCYEKTDQISSEI